MPSQEELVPWNDFGQLLNVLPLSINRSLLLLLYNENRKLSVHLEPYAIWLCFWVTVTTYIMENKCLQDSSPEWPDHFPKIHHFMSKFLIGSWASCSAWPTPFLNTGKKTTEGRALSWGPLSVSLSNVTVGPTGHLSTLWEYLIIPGKCCVPLLWHWWGNHKKTQRWIWKANS